MAEVEREREVPCEVCGGTGQIAYFKGVSRFVLSYQECPVCDGTGIAPEGERGRLVPPGDAESAAEPGADSGS